MDKDQVDRVMRYGFRKETEAYNSFAESKKYLVSGGLSSESVHYWDAGSQSNIEQLANCGIKFDLIISLVSWCFHYPLETYIDLVKKIIADDGVIIIDVRRNTPQEEQLRLDFSLIGVAREDGQSRRLCLRSSRR